MASFRPQTQTPYSTSGNEQTVQTGEALGKALQSVGMKRKNRWAIMVFDFVDLSKRTSVFFNTSNTRRITTREW